MKTIHKQPTKLKTNYTYIHDSIRNNRTTHPRAKHKTTLKENTRTQIRKYSRKFIG